MNSINEAQDNLHSAGRGTNRAPEDKSSRTESQSASAEALNHLIQAKNLFLSAAKELSAHSGQRIDEGIQSGKETLGNQVERGRSFVVERPFSSLGIALGVGFILSLILRK